MAFSFSCPIKLQQISNIATLSTENRDLSKSHAAQYKLGLTLSGGNEKNVIPFRVCRRFLLSFFLHLTAVNCEIVCSNVVNNLDLTARWWAFSESSPQWKAWTASEIFAWCPTFCEQTISRRKFPPLMKCCFSDGNDYFSLGDWNNFGKRGFRSEGILTFIIQRCTKVQQEKEVYCLKCSNIVYE